MLWPTELEKQWRLLLKNLETSTRGFFLIEYDRPFTRDALLRRLQTGFDNRQWQLEIIALSDDRLATRLATDLCELPCKAIVVRLDGATTDHFRALNLAREALYDLPTIVLFLTSPETHTRFLTSAHDLATWTHIPYSFALPEMDFPKLPSLLPDISITLAERIRYYEDQIQHALAQDNRQEAFRLLSPLADLYLDAAMYGAAERMYQILADYQGQAADEQQANTFSRRRDMAQGWRILADLRHRHLLLSEDRVGLKRLLDERMLSVQKTAQGFAVVDETGHMQPASATVLTTLGTLSETVAREVTIASTEGLAILREELAKHFSMEELRTLCFDLGVDFESLPGERKVDKIRELVAYLERRGRVPDLVATASRLRPHRRWEEVKSQLSPIVIGELKERLLQARIEELRKDREELEKQLKELEKRLKE